jgi:hypothetical protein
MTDEDSLEMEYYTKEFYVGCALISEFLISIVK